MAVCRPFLTTGCFSDSAALWVFPCVNWVRGTHDQESQGGMSQATAGVHYTHTAVKLQNVSWYKTGRSST